MNDLRQKLVGLFQTEHAEHLQQIRSLLALIEAAGGTAGRGELDEIYRRAHTLKGAARVVDLKPVEQLSHRLETLFSEVREGKRSLDQTVTRVVRQSLDSSEDYMAALAENRSAGTDITFQAAFQSIEQLLGMRPEATPAPAVTLEHPGGSAPQAPEPPRVVPMKAAESTVRVNSDTLDRFGRCLGQLLAEIQTQARVGDALTEMDRQLQEMGREADRIRRLSAKTLRHSAGQRRTGAMPAYLTAMEQSVQQLARQSRKTRRLQQRSAWAIRVSCELLQQHMLAARTVPVDSLVDGFHKMIRDLARAENKEIEFRTTGTEILADRMVMQALRDPVMHLLRNSVGHGLETREERVAKGKPPTGSLTLRVRSEGQRFVMEVEDDGRGIDVRKVGETAVKKGLLSAEALATKTPSEVACLIFEPGFSTAATVTDLSGRGMGLSVVHETVQRLRGTVTLGKEPSAGGAGSGTCFVLSVPLSIETHRLLLVACQGQVFGVPMQGVAGLFRLKTGQIDTAQGKPLVTLNGKKLPLIPLSHVLKIDSKPMADRALWLVILLTTEKAQAAILVDGLLAERAELIHDIGLPSGISRNVAGAMLQRDGTVSLVLNPAGLLESCGHFETQVTREASKPKPLVRILVVDDSITTRSLEKNVLEASGYEVRVAVDGLEALEKIKAQRPDLVISDVEMPRMNGLQLLEAVRANKETNTLPLILVTSLEKADDIAKGLALGADAYIVKRKFDQRELLDTINQIL